MQPVEGQWRETLGDDVVLRMNAARSPRAAGGASDVDCEERHTKRGWWSQSSPKVSRSRGPFGRGRGQHSCAGTCPKGLGYTTASACCCRSGGILNVILAVAPRHCLKSRPRGHECAALRGAVVDSPALSSGQAQNVRRTGAREEVCCLPTRMMAIVLDHTVPRGEVADPVVCPPRLGGLCKTAPRIHS